VDLVWGLHSSAIKHKDERKRKEKTLTKANVLDAGGAPSALKSVAIPNCSARILSSA
jgi:hypothetical protein